MKLMVSLMRHTSTHNFPRKQFNETLMDEGIRTSGFILRGNRLWLTTRFAQWLTINISGQLPNFDGYLCHQIAEICNNHLWAMSQSLNRHRFVIIGWPW
jgi:hypothetical protein